MIRVTARLANAHILPGLSGTWQRTPVHHSPVTVEAAPDEEGRVAVELPLDEPRVLSVGPGDEVQLFLGDDLHVEADLADLPGSLRFSGRGAANNRFLAAMRARFPDLRIDYEDLEVDAHGELVDRRRRERESYPMTTRGGTAARAPSRRTTTTSWTRSSWSTNPPSAPPPTATSWSGTSSVCGWSR